MASFCAITDDPSDHQMPRTSRCMGRSWMPAAVQRGRRVRRPCAGLGGGTAGHQLRGRLQRRGPLVAPPSSEAAASQVYAGLLSSYRDPNRPNVKEVATETRRPLLRKDKKSDETKRLTRSQKHLQFHDDDTWKWAEQRAKLEKTWMTAQTIGTLPGAELHGQQPHKWVFEDRAWCCTSCSRVVKGRSQRSKQVRVYKTLNTTTASGSKCKGMCPWGAFHGTSPFFYCVRCGAHSGWCMRAQQCKGRPARDSRLLRGLHPLAWRSERQLTCSCTDVGMQWLQLMLWSST